MALIKSMVLDSDVNLPEAYFRISDLNLYYVKSKASIFVSLYKDKQARLDGKAPVTDDVEIQVYNSDEIVGRNAMYEIVLRETLDKENKTITISLLDKSIEITDYEMVEDRDITIQNIVNAINENIIASGFLTAERVFGFIRIRVIDENQLLEEKGNNITFTGENILSFELIENGINSQPGSFDKFFSSKSIYENEYTPLQAGYEYLKTLPEFEGSSDDLDTLY